MEELADRHLGVVFVIRRCHQLLGNGVVKRHICKWRGSNFIEVLLGEPPGLKAWSTLS
jgi:hypothetical protein